MITITCDKCKTHIKHELYAKKFKIDASIINKPHGICWIKTKEEIERGVYDKYKPILEDTYKSFDLCDKCYTVIMEEAYEKITKNI